MGTQSVFEEHNTAASADGHLRLTLGYIVMVAMPDFSMPFNVIALSVTAVTFWFGSIFRLTASGRVPHWVLKKGELPADSLWKKTLKRLILLALLGGFVSLKYVNVEQLNEAKNVLPEGAAFLVGDILLPLKEYADQLP